MCFPEKPRGCKLGGCSGSGSHLLGTCDHSRLAPACVHGPGSGRSEAEVRGRARSWQSPCSLQEALSSGRPTATLDLSSKTHPHSRFGCAAEKSSNPKNVQASTFQL